jgi:transcription-repair coupling factor (superfamily II helicase)
MPSGTLDDIMTAFYDSKYDVLLSTTIIEIRSRRPDRQYADRASRRPFRLSQLYQLRGRVGARSCAPTRCFTLPTRKITAQAEKRLKVLQSLDTLGAGFQLASHDLDIRGAGNLLGDEQSGHIKEVGFELYQQMLEEAVESLKAGIAEPVADRWSPQITIGTPVLIPTTTSPICRCGCRSIAAWPRSTTSRRSSVRAELGRPFRQDAGRGRSSAQDRRHQGALPRAPMSRRSIPARRARCSRSATTRSTIRKASSPSSAIRALRARVRPDMKVVFFEDWEKPEAASLERPPSCAHW